MQSVKYSLSVTLARRDPFAKNLAAWALIATFSVFISGHCRKGGRTNTVIPSKYFLTCSPCLWHVSFCMTSEYRAIHGTTLFTSFVVLPFSARMNEPLEPFPLRVTADSLRKLEKIAKRDERSISQLIRKCIEWGSAAPRSRTV